MTNASKTAKQFGIGDFFVTTDAPHPKYGPLFKDAGPWEVVGGTEDELYAWPVLNSDATGELVLLRSELHDHILNGRIIPLERDEVGEHRSNTALPIIVSTGKSDPVLIYLPEDTYEAFTDVRVQEGQGWVEDALKTKVASTVGNFDGNFRDFVREAIEEGLVDRGLLNGGDNNG